jgi:hypothetical protein
MLRRRQAFSAVCSSNLGKRGRRDSCSRRTVPAVALNESCGAEQEAELASKNIADEIHDRLGGDQTII